MDDEIEICLNCQKPECNNCLENTTPEPRIAKIDPKTGEQMVYRDLYPGFILPELAVTDPEAWKKRLHDVPDPFYEAEDILKAKEEQRLISEARNEGLDYANNAFDSFDRWGR